MCKSSITLSKSRRVNSSRYDLPKSHVRACIVGRQNVIGCGDFCEVTQSYINVHTVALAQAGSTNAATSVKNGTSTGRWERRLRLAHRPKTQETEPSCAWRE